MAQWYIKELSELTHVSVQTLHYYDKIDLLKPSLRHANGYRIYSEADLLKLQKIIALKFFCFELAQIKKILALKADAINFLLEQAKLLKEKTKSLHEVCKTLDDVIVCVNFPGSSQPCLPWEAILKTVESYHEAKKLKEKSLNDEINPDELKEYLHFEDMIKLNFAKKEKKLFDKKWACLIKEIVSSLDQDPTGEDGVVIATRIMELMETLDSKTHKSIQSIIWEKGFKAGKILSDMSPETLFWIDAAMDAYWRVRKD